MTCTCRMCAPVKPAHGAPNPTRIPHDMHLAPPEGCPLRPGDRVTYTNDQGVTFHGKTVKGFTKAVGEDGRCVYIDSDSWWFPVRPDRLRKDTAE